MEKILHPTDMRVGSEAAFAHALAIAVVHQCDLTLLHVGGESGERDSLTGFPAVRGTLERWGLLEEGSRQADVHRLLGVRVRKVVLSASKATEAILDEAERREPDLIVLASRAGGGTSEFWRPSVSRPVARRSRIPTLLVPHGARGFVEPGTGAISLRRVLAPVAATPDPLPALMTAGDMLRAFASESAGVDIELLHVGVAGGGANVPDEKLPRARLSRRAVQGDVVEQVAARAEALDVDLVVMATEGRRGVMDSIRGSVTERVLAKLARPALVTPAEAWRDEEA